MFRSFSFVLQIGIWWPFRTERLQDLVLLKFMRCCCSGRNKASSNKHRVVFIPADICFRSALICMDEYIQSFDRIAKSTVILFS